ncbi:CaiB/BaiF CoA transferase family protein [Sphingomonas immobilis]|uniref:CaiB/BaiF CoA-transferase family protein n=1 Tax=Sphingomonas immobilis TaxID=3063997 RepID=A0ABT8ZZA0_9SPHN|nr:CaiB/BaiF CoA-transferase family protein [Sphingomonas sp. CA1-15]MDO7842315.1 CaiB/BaiF CoA-transferase family protein [Sphingomonas sp. CA1-15]
MSLPKPLAGIRVVDLGRTFAAPFCTQMLADLGADVIKLERKTRGDEMRHYGPPFVKDANGNDVPISSYFIGANRGKKSVEVDLTKPGAQQIVRDLAAISHVMVENFKVGDLARYGLDYAGIREVAPDIVYCSITGFGQTGPYAPRPGTDSVFQAMSGMMSITGEPDQPPTKIGLIISDLITGLYASNAIQAALRVREQGGPGQHIDMALLDVAVATMSHRAIDYLMTGDIPLRLGTAAAGSAPAQTYSCKDGMINIQASAEDKFRIFCGVIDRLDLLTHPLFGTRAERFTNVAALEVEITRTLADWALGDLYEALVAANIICSPIYTVDQCFADPQIVSRDLARTVVDSSGITLPMIANPIRMSETPVNQVSPPPQLGEHTDSVLHEVLGYDDARIAALRAEGAI